MSQTKLLKLSFIITFFLWFISCLSICVLATSCQKRENKRLNLKTETSGATTDTTAKTNKKQEAYEEFIGLEDSFNKQAGSNKMLKQTEDVSCRNESKIENSGKTYVNNEESLNDL